MTSEELQPLLLRHSPDSDFNTEIPSEPKEEEKTVYRNERQIPTLGYVFPQTCIPSQRTLLTDIEENGVHSGQILLLI
jgi:hypothetical protein